MIELTMSCSCGSNLRFGGTSPEADDIEALFSSAHPGPLGHTVYVGRFEVPKSLLTEPHAYQHISTNDGPPFRVSLGPNT